jgi:NAD(P)-dependent dehydrogenase (short-subunit alcohol dehydrogenase family)
VDTYLDRLFSLSGKVAAITGAGGHICGEMARGFARAGCTVALLDIRLEKAQSIQSELFKEGYLNVYAHAVDVTIKSDHMSALEAILDQFGKVDVFVNGAGINAPTPFLEIDLDEWHRVLDSQITGTMLGCQIFGAQMLKQANGSIINISSASAGPPLSKAFAYSVAKAGIVNLTQNLAREWGSSGVRVNSIRPGFFPTEWNRKNFITPQREAAIIGHTPMGRFGTPSELLGATLWLASDASSFVTGSEIAIDGGFSCMSI